MKTILTLFRRTASQKGAAILFVVGLLSGGSGTVCAVSVDDFVARWFTNAQGILPYRLFIPTNYNSAERFPLVLFLHGVGESGSDNRSQLVGQIGPLVFASETNQVEHPSFMVAPQCPLGYSWTDLSMRLRVLGMLNALQSEFSVDTNRLYVTGLSLGGAGTWDYIGQYPGMYAAAVPMSGWGNSVLASRMTQIAIWNFHAVDDDVVAVSKSRSTVWIIRWFGGNPIYTEYASGGHAIWTPAYNTPGLMDWVYAQRRGVASTTEPLLTIISPTADSIWRTGATNLNLVGTAGARGQAVTAVSWTNFANDVNGIAAGGNLWSVTDIPLQANEINIVSVVATTTSWVPAYGGATTFNNTLFVTQSPILATLTLQGAGAILDWTGGGPPYRVQRATDVAAGDWTNYLTGVAPPVTLPLTNPAGLYRIVGQ